MFLEHFQVCGRRVCCPEDSLEELFVIWLWQCQCYDWLEEGCDILCAATA